MAQKRDLAVYLDVPVPPYEPLSRFQEFQVFAEDKILERQAIRIEKGDTRVTVSELGLSHHRIYRDHVLVFPPFLPVQGEWERADGRVARFSFSQRFSEPLPIRWARPCRLTIFGTLSLRSISSWKRCAGF